MHRTQTPWGLASAGLQCPGAEWEETTLQCCMHPYGARVPVGRRDVTAGDSAVSFVAERGQTSDGFIGENPADSASQPFERRI
ncbi:hypothetical protein OsI_12809 [Oryza sativa Indica Group]|uniref:Uncharacterized protein n=1 Tax=Oryza sativa subsp. indica TaxID=39946 RepID=A2XK39_ORYSI|nr:hypothetical protein OsI_12809 [Oryza sativa Indica Group]